MWRGRGPTFVGGLVSDCRIETLDCCCDGSLSGGHPGGGGLLSL